MTGVKDEFETLLYKVEAGVATVTLNRPERMNAINARLKAELAHLFFEVIEPDNEVRVVVLIGAGKAFCAGADIKERARQTLNGAELYQEQKKTLQLFRRIEQFSRPVIAAVNGVALGGGCEIALLCDLRIASVTARFGLPEVKLGTIPLGGGTQRLARLLGEAKAKELIFTGDFIDAPEAYRLGLVNRLVATDNLLDEAQKLARQIAAQPPLALRFAKQAISQGLQTDLDSALEFELYAGSILNDTEDRKEGMQAFVEKRAPVFKGR
jgi:enoyl-CoA hydratase